MSHFYAYVSRMKLIERWSLMHNLRPENVQEHSLQVAIVAHSLATIGNKYFEKNYNADRICTLAIFHDATEVLTGDLPTPVKYFNPDIKNAYKEIEKLATDKLLSYLPNEMLEEYSKIFKKQVEDTDSWKIVKAADSLCAYIKCVEESAAGNKEFNRAKITIENSLREMNMEEVGYFIKNFLHSFSLSLDELSLH